MSQRPRHFRFEKLIRDRWADISRPFGVEARAWGMGKEEHLSALKAKIIEEAEEVAAAQIQQDVLEELADVLEVVHAIARLTGFCVEDVEKARLLKHQAKGGFDQGCYCQSVTLEPTSPYLSYYLANPQKYPEFEES